MARGKSSVAGVPWKVRGWLQWGQSCGDSGASEESPYFTQETECCGQICTVELSLWLPVKSGWRGTD